MAFHSDGTTLASYTDETIEFMSDGSIVVYCLV